jgi:hypothetical protein
VPRLDDARAPATVSESTQLRWWPDAVPLALGALLIRIPAFFAPSNLGYEQRESFGGTLGFSLRDFRRP